MPDQLVHNAARSFPSFSSQRFCFLFLIFFSSRRLMKAPGQTFDLTCLGCEQMGTSLCWRSRRALRSSGPRARTLRSHPPPYDSMNMTLGRCPLSVVCSRAASPPLSQPTLSLITVRARTLRSRPPLQTIPFF